MCPSYRATRDEVHSTRGRAKLLGEMFQGEPVRPTWRSEEVREALELCLSCKGCASDCPTHVDMATYKSEFLFHYYRGRRPAAMYAMGLMPWAGRLTTTWPAVGQHGQRRPGRAVGGAGAQAYGGHRHEPARAPVLGRRGAAPVHPRATCLWAVDRDPRDTTVVIWPDTFTDAFRPDMATDLVVAMEGLGERPAVPSGWACCGRTLYDFGMLDLARRSLRRLVRVLGPWVVSRRAGGRGRTELPGRLPGRTARLAGGRPPERGSWRPWPAARRSTWWRAGRSPGGRLPARAAGVGRAVVHAHCHQRAVVGTDADQAVLAALGYQVELLDAGCCGLAGSFGFNARHEPVSRTIGEDLWLPKVRAALGDGDDPPAQLVVDGFSCHTQLEHLGPELAGPRHDPSRSRPTPPGRRRGAGVRPIDGGVVAADRS